MTNDPRDMSVDQSYLVNSSTEIYLPRSPYFVSSDSISLPMHLVHGKIELLFFSVWLVAIIHEPVYTNHLIKTKLDVKGISVFVMKQGRKQ